MSEPVVSAHTASNRVSELMYRSEKLPRCGPFWCDGRGVSWSESFPRRPPPQVAASDVNVRVRHLPGSSILPPRMGQSSLALAERQLQVGAPLGVCGKLETVRSALGGRAFAAVGTAIEAQSDPQAGLSVCAQIGTASHQDLPVDRVPIRCGMIQPEDGIFLIG